MILFPNAKINLGLNVVAKRADGFHDLETVFFLVSCCDVLEIIQDKKPVSRKWKFTILQSGIKIEGKPENNLIAKAYNLLNDEFISGELKDKDFYLPDVLIHLHKNIPLGAGLGGGSADAAFVLKGLNELFELKLSEEQLIHYAGKLGSDCPFFIKNKPVFAGGRGDVFEPVEVDLRNYKILIVWPGIHSSTADAFAGIVPKKPHISIKEILKKDISFWKEELKNDFEETIFKRYPEIKAVKEKLYSAGAVYASLSGSGSAVYGIFEKKIPELNWPANYIVFN